MALQRVPEPVSEAPKVPFLRRVTKPDEAFEGIALAEDVFWTFTHFHLLTRRTFTCDAIRDDEGSIVDHERCENCLSGQPARKRGYLHVWAIKERREEFLEISPDAWKYCKACWPAIPMLRGWRIACSRPKGKTSVMILVLKEPQPSTDMRRLPIERLPDETLGHVMRL